MKLHFNRITLFLAIFVLGLVGSTAAFSQTNNLSTQEPLTPIPLERNQLTDTEMKAEKVDIQKEVAKALEDNKNINSQNFGQQNQIKKQDTPPEQTAQHFSKELEKAPFIRDELKKYIASLHDTPEQKQALA